jgi:hypothetical protein
MEGFSLYDNSIHKISLQHPSNWDREEMFNNEAGAQGYQYLIHYQNSGHSIFAY